MAYGDDHQSFRELTELARENNKILRGLRRTARWHGFFSFIKWVVILVSIAASYYYLQPQIDNLRDLKGSIPSLDEAIENLKNLSDQLPNAGN